MEYKMKNVLQTILISFVTFTIISCGNDSGLPVSVQVSGAESTGSNGTNGKNSLISSTTESSGANCTTGGLKVQYGLDSDEDGVLDSTEVNSTKYICNGNGTDGDNGTDGIKPSAQLACDAALENTSLYFEYKATVFTDGSVLAHASIYGVAVEVTDSTFYDSSQNGASTGYVNIRYDVSGTDNGGDWKISVNRSTLVTTVLYEDTDLSGGSLTWTLASSNCTTNSF
jgi:hypothetical protein